MPLFSNKMEPNSPLTVIAKTTKDCNLECKYCLTEENSDSGNMNLETLENMLIKVSSQNSKFGKTTIIWHGGEPLIMGLDFYKEAVKIQKSVKNHSFTNDLQTNGLRLEEYIDFFKKEKFNLGFSLDGPAHIQNYTRPQKGGAPSFDKTFEMIKEAKKHKIGSGAIFLLNSVTNNHLEEIYNFFKENKIHHQVNPQIPSGRAKINTDLAMSPTNMGKALVKYFDMWFNDYSEPVIDVDPFSKIIYNLSMDRNKKLKLNYPYGCNFSNDCANTFIGISPKGNVYPCGRLSGNEEFFMGNINKNNMNTIMYSQARLKMMDRNNDILQECNPCDYKTICNSGCPDNAYLFHGDIMQKDGLCATNKIIFSHIEKVLLKELK